MVNQNSSGRTGLTIGLLNAGLTLAVVRILSSYSWLNGAFVGKDAKFTADFLSGTGLAKRINETFVHTTASEGISSWLTNSVVPNASLFAWLLALGEAGVGISLLLGLFTRLGGFFAVVQALANMLVVGGMGADTIDQNYLLALLGIAFIITAAGRTLGLDGILIKRFPNSRLLRFVG